MLGMEIIHPVLNYSILIPFRTAATFTPDHIFSVIERVAQSHHTLTFDQFMTIRAVIVRNPKGAGGQKRPFVVANRDAWVKSHCGHGGALIEVCCNLKPYNIYVSLIEISFAQINNKDNLCFPRAVVTAKAIVDNDPSKDTITRGDKQRCNMQKRLAQKLMVAAGLQKHTASCGLEQYEKVQAALPAYRITIYEAGNLKDVMFQGNT